MTERYFSEEPIRTERVALTGREAHHLLHVMRARPGHEVVLFDGSGDEFTARVESLGRHRVELAVLSRRRVERESPLALVLAVALPKGDRQSWLVEKAVELGAGALIPIECRRGVSRPTDNALRRLKQTVIEASKQCGRNRLMAIDQPRDWPSLVASTNSSMPRWLAHPRAQATAAAAPCYQAIANLRTVALKHQQALIAVGPEGGFTAEEVELAVAAGWRCVDLGPRILRVETAALVAAALLLVSD
jgi:16S rRNA (uracil1498-N3)-methyltransferase